MVSALKISDIVAYCNPTADTWVVLKGHLWLVRDVLAHEIDGGVSNRRRTVRNSFMYRCTNIRPAQISRVDSDRSPERFDGFRAVSDYRCAHTSEDRLEDQSKSGLQGSCHLDDNARTISLCKQIVFATRSQHHRAAQHNPFEQRDDNVTLTHARTRSHLRPCDLSGLGRSGFPA